MTWTPHVLESDAGHMVYAQTKDGAIVGWLMEAPSRNKQHWFATLDEAQAAAETDNTKGLFT